MLKRARWIINQLHRLDLIQSHPAPRQYVSGETHWYLGRRYLLKVKQDPQQLSNTKLLRGRLQVNVVSNTPNSVKRQLQDWYIDKAKIVFQRKIEAISSELGWVNRVPTWQLRTMKKQWGSCSPKGKLSLNPMLIKAPRQCIDYVILHELCHLKHHNHSDQFYRLLKRKMPDWESVKNQLDNMSEIFLH